MSTENESNNTVTNGDKKVCELYPAFKCKSFDNPAMNSKLKMMGNMNQRDIEGFKQKFRAAVPDVTNTYENLNTFINDKNKIVNIDELRQKIVEIITEYKTIFETISHGETNLYAILLEIAGIKSSTNNRSPYIESKLKNYFDCVVSYIFMNIFTNSDTATILVNIENNIDNAITEDKFNEITSIENIKKNSLPDARQVMCIQRFSHDINGKAPDKCSYLFHGVGTGKTITSTSIALNYLIKNKKDYCYDIKRNLIKTAGQISGPVFEPICQLPIAVPVNQHRFVVDGQPADNTTSDNVKDIEFKILIVAPPGLFRSAFIKDFNSLGIITLNTVVFNISDEETSLDNITIETVDGFYKIQPEYYENKIYPGEPNPAIAEDNFYKIKFIGCDYTNFFKKNSRNILLKNYPNINVVIFDEAHRLLNNRFIDSKNEIVQVHFKNPMIMNTGIKAKNSDAFCAMEDFELYNFCSKIKNKVIYLTGTPFQKTPMDIVTIINHINFLNHENTKNWKKFYKKMSDANAWLPLKCPYEGSGPIHDIKCAAFSMYRIVFDWSNQRKEHKLSSILNLIIQGLSIYAQMDVAGAGYYIATKLMDIASKYGSFSGGQRTQTGTPTQTQTQTGTPTQRQNDFLERLQKESAAFNAAKNPSIHFENKTQGRTTSGDEIDSLVKQLIMFLKQPYFRNFMGVFKQNVVFKLLTYNIDPAVVKTNIHIINMTEQIIYGKLLKESIMNEIFAKTNPTQNGGAGDFGEILFTKTFGAIVGVLKKMINSFSVSGFIKTISENKSNMIKYILTLALSTVISSINININVMVDTLSSIVSGVGYIFEYGIPALCNFGITQLPYIVSGIIQVLSSTLTEIINQYNEYDYTSFLEYSIDYVSIYNYDFNKYAIDKNTFYKDSENMYNNKPNYKDFFTNTGGNKNNFPIKHIQYIFMPYSSEALVKFVETGINNETSKPIEETSDQDDEGTWKIVEDAIGDEYMSNIDLQPVDLNATLNSGCNVKKNCGMPIEDFNVLKNEYKQKYQPQIDSSCQGCTETFMNYTRDMMDVESEKVEGEIGWTRIMDDTNYDTNDIEYVIYNNKKVLNTFAKRPFEESLFYDAITKDDNRFEHILILLKIMKLGLVINNINQFDYHSHYCIKEKDGAKSLHYFLPVFYPTTTDIMYSFIQFLEKQNCKYIWLNEDDTNEQIDNNYQIGYKSTFPIHTLSGTSQNYRDIVGNIDTSQPICVILSPSHTEGFSFTKNPAIILPALCKTAGDAEQVYGRVLRKYRDDQIMNNRYIKQIYQYYGSNSEIEKSNLKYWNTLYGFGENNPNLIFKEALMFEKINVNEIDENITPTVSDTTEGYLKFADYQTKSILSKTKKFIIDKENSIIISAINQKFKEYKQKKLDEILKPILEINKQEKIDNPVIFLQKNYPEEYKNVFVNISNLLLYTLTDMDQLNEIYKINLVAAKYFVQMAAPENRSFKGQKIIPMDRAMLLNHKNYLQLTERDIEPDIKNQVPKLQEAKLQEAKLQKAKLDQVPKLMVMERGGKRTRKRKPALTRRKKSTRAPRRKITRAKKHKNKHTKKFA